MSITEEDIGKECKIFGKMDGIDFNGIMGTVIDLNNVTGDSIDYVGVRIHDPNQFPNKRFHNCGGKCKSGEGFYFKKRFITIIDRPYKSIW